MDRFQAPVTITALLRRLSPRELEVLEQLAGGGYYRDIGETLEISPATVRAHLHSIYQKLGVKSRTQAVAKAYGIGRPPELTLAKNAPV
jgi:DNA-binding CsgD family transcriptional regulator